MAIRVMLADDSHVVRSLIGKTLNKEADILLVGAAQDGEEAIKLAKQHQPDVILLDIEMPKMDGMMALPFLLDAVPGVKIIMASHLTTRNAGISLEALARGAADYVPKPMMDGLDDFFYELLQKTRALATTRKPSTTFTAAPTSAPVPVSPKSAAPIILRPETNDTIQMVAIASSTGGPQSLVGIFTELKTKLSHLPIFITQHMPATFTSVFAEHLQRASGIPAAEGREGEKICPGRIYVAPGGFHMRAVRDGNHAVIRLNQDEKIHHCRPAADPMFQSLSELYGPKLLALVLTGMGRDGADGAKAVAQRGGTVIAQDEATSVVYGMPRAVAEQGLCQKILPLGEIAPYLVKRC